MIAREKLLKAYEQAFASEAGAIVLADLDRVLRRRSHTPGDPCTTAFLEGERSIVLGIHEMLDAAASPPHPETVSTLSLEEMNRE